MSSGLRASQDSFGVEGGEQRPSRNAYENENKGRFKEKKRTEERKRQEEVEEEEEGGGGGRREVGRTTVTEE